MRNIIILSLFLLLLCIGAFLASCDDFFSPTIEIFNEVKTPITIEQDQEQDQDQEQVQTIPQFQDMLFTKRD